MKLFISQCKYFATLNKLNMIIHLGLLPHQKGLEHAPPRRGVVEHAWFIARLHDVELPGEVIVVVIPIPGREGERGGKGGVGGEWGRAWGRAWGERGGGAYIE